MGYFNESIQPDLITYQPEIKDIGSSVFCLKCGIVSVVLGSLSVIFLSDNEIGGFFGLCALILIPAGLFRIIFRNRTILIFDANARCIYKKKPKGKPWKVMSFDDVHSLSIETESVFFFYTDFCYCLSRKENVFGRGSRISPYFKKRRNKKYREAFETNILPAVQEMLKIGGRSTRVASSNIYIPGM